MSDFESSEDIQLAQAGPEPLGLNPSFGFGDRIGLATEGHVRAIQCSGHGILPIFAQQSIREMARTRRSPEDVMRDALDGALRAGYHGRQGADADHLKTDEDVARTAEAGFVFFTLDPSDLVDRRADDYSGDMLQSRRTELEAIAPWLGRYLGQTVSLGGGAAIELTEEACLRAAAKYGRALQRAVLLGTAVDRQMGGTLYEVELSVDETDQPTSLAEHWIVGRECLESGMRLVSLAPRFVGDFEKGVDFKGSIEEFTRSLSAHAAVARELGPYKLSLHSGSDKLSVYTAFARETRGLFHVKTAGTSYLEALRVAARKDAALFRGIIAASRARYDDERATYHVSATLQGVPPPEAVPSNLDLERLYLGLWSETPAGSGFTAPGRQILHCAYGSILTDPKWGTELRSLLESNRALYAELLEEHFSRHLSALELGM